MHLVLRAVTLGGAQLTQTLSGHFDARGGTLGRAEDNTLTLPDPKRHISRQQAELSLDARGYSISNIGSGNPILLNQQPVAPGESAGLADGDELQVGAYLLQVSVTPQEPGFELARAARAASASAPPPLPAGILPHDFSFAKAASGQSWHGDPAELLRPVGAAHSGSLDGLTDPEHGHELGHRHGPVHAHERGGDALQRFLNAEAQTAAAPAAASVRPEARPPGAPCHADPLRLVLPRRPVVRVPVPAAAAVDRTPDLHAAMPLPRPLAADRALPARSTEPDVDVDVTVPAPITEPTGSAGDANMGANSGANISNNSGELWAAFCAGTGVPLTAPQGLNAPLMRLIGELLRHLVGGTVQLVRIRAETKNELRFPATMLRTQGNNPLRYSPNVTAALTQLLQPPLSGFMAGPEAAQEAMDDLFAHAIGTMTGMRAAIEGVLRRFEPPRLEAQISGSQVLDTLLPMHRRARLWDLYMQHFDGVRSEAQEDFDRLFGQAFVDAYGQQLDRLDAERRARRRQAR